MGRAARKSKVATRRSLRDGPLALDPAADDVDALVDRHAIEASGRALSVFPLYEGKLTPHAIGCAWGSALRRNYAETGAPGGAGTRASSAARRRWTTRFTAISTSATSRIIVASTFTCGGMP